MSRVKNTKPFVVPSISSAVAVHPLPVTHGPLRVIVQRGEPSPLAGAELDAWNALVAKNPKYFDGAIVAVKRLPVGDNTILASVDRYARLAVQPSVKTGVCMLAVTGVLIASDASGREHVLLGKRAKNVRCYPGLWEVGPSGGIEAAAIGAVGDSQGEQSVVLGEQEIVAQLAKEIEEEIGLIVHDGPAKEGIRTRARAMSVGILSDLSASSEDIVVIVQLGIDAHELMRELSPASIAERWEYDDVRVVPIDTLAEFENQHEMIPPSRVLVRALGMMGSRD